MSVQRFIDPAVLSGISGLDLIAKTVVDGFIAGLHRSPNFGFSQEFPSTAPTRPETTCATSTGTFTPAPSAPT